MDSSVRDTIFVVTFGTEEQDCIIDKVGKCQYKGGSWIEGSSESVSIVSNYRAFIKENNTTSCAAKSKQRLMDIHICSGSMLYKSP